MGLFDFLFANNNVNRVYGSKGVNPEQQETTRAAQFNEEFSEDLYAGVYGGNPTGANNSYSDNGVILQNANILRLTYSGILVKNGAQDVYAVVGYGNNLRWEDVETYPLRAVGQQTYELLLPVKRSGNINLAFKDGSGNWDNNSGMNYTFFDQSTQGSH